MVIQFMSAMIRIEALELPAMAARRSVPTSLIEFVSAYAESCGLMLFGLDRHTLDEFDRYYSRPKWPLGISWLLRAGS